MSQYLFEVQQHNRLSQKGLLKRFSIECIGHQPTLEEIKEEKSKIFNKLKNNRNSDEYKKYFFNYKPGETRSKHTQKARFNKSKKRKQFTLRSLFNWIKS